MCANKMTKQNSQISSMLINFILQTENTQFYYNQISRVTNRLYSKSLKKNKNNPPKKNKKKTKTKKQKTKKNKNKNKKKNKVNQRIRECKRKYSKHSIQVLRPSNFH